MDFKMLIELFIKYLPDIIECLSQMPDDRRTRLMAMLEDKRARSLLLRLLERKEDKLDLQALFANLVDPTP